MSCLHNAQQQNSAFQNDLEEFAFDPSVVNIPRRPATTSTSSNQLLQPQPYLGHLENQNLFISQIPVLSAHNGLLQPPFKYRPRDINFENCPSLDTNLPRPTTFTDSTFISTPSPSMRSFSSSPVLQQEGTSLNPELSMIQSLDELFGPLKIEINGIAPYIRQQTSLEYLPTPVIPCIAENTLPAAYTDLSSPLTIPEDLMPCEQDAIEYFDLFFDHVHPYIPVIHRARFYEQWNADKNSVSPLLLEAVFACAGMICGDPAIGMRWLNLANVHESAFLEAPRLSTIQALLLLLKAREVAPKNGYYYRSWQLVKTMISMAKDLNIHEHYSYHADGKNCGMESTECLIKSRVWQTLLITEVLIGVPQGLKDFGVDIETVEARTSWNISGLDAYETERSRQYSYFVRIALNIRRFTDSYNQTKKQHNWAKDPRFTKNNNLLDQWLTDLPADLQVSLPSANSSPWLSSHFMGNLNICFHLNIILQYRPQLEDSAYDQSDGMWKARMDRSLSSAKTIYHLQEAIVSSYGLHGLCYMQRGIRFTVYCTLTCLTVYLKALTFTESHLDIDAKLYFSRHMRLLEQCNEEWPLPEIQASLYTVRAALSANINMPFDLNSFIFPFDFDSHNSTQVAQPIPQNTPNRALQSPDTINDATASPVLLSTRTEIIPTTPLPMIFEMLPCDTAISSSLGIHLEDGLGIWDPTRLVTQTDLELSSGALLSPASSPASVVTPNRNAGDYNFPIQFDMITSPFQKDCPYYTFDFEASATSRGIQDWNGEISGIYSVPGLKRKWDEVESFFEGQITTTKI
ncbi:hypothetical protein LOZ51_004043 [Ophidiomyces ophidiicola]|nr:hypothetical protein LOZ55_003220 [Ophidiomyces ophidiicola]KAI1988823.1 hypothetical protein LOZ54_003060 [Ophidiomyces ophidiicola]KAI1993664.1 hypothetical protein LOZ51_004043 [Ophidiomyces ophidiicola]